MISESVVTFGKSNSLVGIVTSPGALPAAELPGVILLNAGLIHRIGPHRLYVKIARMLAGMGHAVLRFDMSGVGDSQPREDHLPLAESVVVDIKDAMDVLSQQSGKDKFVLMGHCSGAIQSFMVAGQDARVVGAVLMNPTRSVSDWSEYDRKRKLANYYTNYYGREAVFDSQRWAKLLTGRADYRSITQTVFKTIVWNKLSTMYFRLRKDTAQSQEDMPELPQQIQDAIELLHALAERGVHLLFIYSEGSTGMEFFEATMGDVLTELRADGKLKQEIIPQADHLFTLLKNQQDLMGVIGNWTEDHWPTPFVSIADKMQEQAES